MGKKILFGIVIWCFWISLEAAHTSIAIQGSQAQKMGICVAYIGTGDLKIKEVAHGLARDLAASGQFYADVQGLDVPPAHRQTIHDYHTRGYQFVLIINHASKKRDIEYRLYDATMGRMIKEASGKYKKQQTRVNGWYHYIAQKIWPVLTGDEGPFMSKIAYSKEMNAGTTYPATQLCLCDYDGSFKQVLVGGNTFKLAPRWGICKNKVQIFYSQQGAVNTHLVCFDEDYGVVPIYGAKSEIAALNFVMAPDGTSAVYAAARDNGCFQLYWCKDGERIAITSALSNALSPSFSADSRSIFFCSDEINQRPQIMLYDINQGKTKVITRDGYCMAPMAHPLNSNQVIYLKLMGDGDIQVFLGDVLSNTHTQLTFDLGTKDECCWSPCGNYIAYECRLGRQRSIMTLHIKTGVLSCITDPKERCMYPSWSKSFNIHPI